MFHSSESILFEIARLPSDSC